MKEETGVDLKIKISNDLLKWFLNESEAFYLLTDQNGKILSFSENVSTYFSLNNDYDVFNNSISKYIGDENWQLLSIKINSNPENIENYLILHQHINSTYTLGSKWKSYKDEDKNRIFLIFKNITKKNQLVEEKEKLEYIETEIQTNINYYKECLDIIEIPVAILKNKDFFYKNKQFEYFFQNENNNNYNTLINCIKNHSIDRDIKIENLNNNFNIEIKKDDIHYKFISKNSFKEEELNFIYLIKSENEKLVEIKETESLIQENELLQKNKLNIINEQLNDIKVIFQEEYNKITGNLNFDLNSFFNKINNNYTEYEKIITYTSENLLNMSESFNFIEEISVKIHLISINAAIESAKSGEQGKGFAVIAREIAKLSTDIKAYTKKIGKQLKSINEYTKTITVKEEIKNFKSLDEFKNIPILLDSIKSRFTDTTNKISTKINDLLIKD